MLTSQFANLVTFFYPLGNTPAVSLTQDLPLEKKADILLLGSGDVRNILFTIHTDPRPLDVTCCDVEKAVIARNILLISLLADDVDGTKNDACWNLFYHFRLDQTSLELLKTQAQKLLALSTSLGVWHESKYGKLVRMCDHGSLVRVREMWHFYGLEREGQELIHFKERCRASILKSKQHRNLRGSGLTLTGLRSAFPAFIHSINDLSTLYDHYWEHGSTDLDQVAPSMTMNPNPMFMSPDDNVVLHYGTDPLLGFHLASAYVPLTAGSPLFRPSTGLSSLQNLVEAAKNEFKTWAQSFRKFSQSVRLRFFVGDALAFSHSLQSRTGTECVMPTQWYRDRFHFGPLDLADEDYAKGGSAPHTFTVIDTSNLIDHVGALNLLVATAPLLAHDISATLYTEKLVRLDSTYSSLFENLLCGPLSTISMLLGITLADSVTNTSALSSGDEVLLNKIHQGMDTKSVESAGQMYTRMVWKRPIREHDALNSLQPPERMEFDSAGLAAILYQIYLKMFESENVSQMMSNITMLKVQKLSIPMYHRVSFVAFVSALKIRVHVDWQETMNALLGHIEANVSHLMSANYIQELYTWLHLLNIYSVDVLKTPPDRSIDGPKMKDLRDWKNIPSVVCVTLVVPREKLKVFTGLDAIKVGTPPIHCVVQGSLNGRPWQNIFGAIQIGFGQVQSNGAPFSESFTVSVIEDKSGWGGTSPLLASFYAPTWTLLQQPRTASVEFGIQSTPQSVQTFIGSLGLQLSIYRTTLSDSDHVYVSKSLPNQAQPAFLDGSTTSVVPAPNIQNSAVNTTIAVHVDLGSAKVTSLTGHVDIRSNEYKTLLRAGGPVTSSLSTPFNFAVCLGSEHTFTVGFPAAVLESGLKTKVARKSSYLELIAQIAGGADWPKFRSFIYPVFLDSGNVTTWNMPRLNLHSLPILDTRQSKQLEWLTTHTSMMWSARERSLRAQPSLQASAEERSRVEFKDSLFSLFMHFSGVQGQRAQVFGITCPEDGGVNILVFVSSLRLDLSNRTVVLDVAILPLYDALMSRIRTFLQTLTKSGKLCQVSTTKAEMRVWKQVLPAYVERCRTWCHKPECQYLKEQRIPLSVETGDKVLCSCGEGVLPTSFITSVPSWNTVAQYAVRAAISPCFSAVMFETGQLLEKVISEEQGGRADTCRTCKKGKKADGSDLLNCARCHRVKYCSRECQRADWKIHKPVCQAP